MARGKDRHTARLQLISALGRPLTRRARSRCELCQSDAGKLKPMEVTPLEDEPSIDRCVLLCPICSEGATNRHVTDDPHWFCLREAVWSEHPPIQVVAVRIVRALSMQGVNWAIEVNDGLYLSEALHDWIEAT